MSGIQNKILDQEIDSKNEKKRKLNIEKNSNSMRKIRILYNDPDATDSSSDEDEIYDKKKSLLAGGVKRFVKEIFLPDLPYKSCVFATDFSSDAKVASTVASKETNCLFSEEDSSLASKPIECSWRFLGGKAPTTTDDDPSLEQSILIVHVKETWQLQLETLDDSPTILLDEIVSPAFETMYQIPPHVLALPTLRKDYVLDVLEGLNLNHAVCGDLGSQLESFAVELSETYGVKDFEMVAGVKVTRASVVSCEEQVRVLEGMGLVEHQN